jgi:hypothetical protein
VFKNVTFISLCVVVFLSSMKISAQDVDPTKPLAATSFTSIAKAEEIAKAELVLESIVHGYEVHTAVINGHVLKVGDFIRQYKLVAVNSTSVVLRSAEKRLKLSVFSGVVVKSK